MIKVEQNGPESEIEINGTSPELIGEFIVLIHAVYKLIESEDEELAKAAKNILTDEVNSGELFEHEEDNVSAQ